MTSVRSPSGRELKLVDTADPNALTPLDLLYLGVTWVPQLTPRLKRLYLRGLDRDALKILEGEGPLPSSELTELLELSGRFKDSKLETEVSKATVEEWLTYTCRRRLIERETDQGRLDWRITTDGRDLLRSRKITTGFLSGLPKAIALIGGILGIIATVVGGAEAFASALEAEKDVLEPIAKFVLLGVLYWGTGLAAFKWFDRHLRRRRIGVLEVLRSAGRVPVSADPMAGVVAGDRTPP